MIEYTNKRFAELCGQGYEIHHVAWARGYVSRKGHGYFEEYSGRFGTGYKWHVPTEVSTQYHTVYYLIKEA